MAPHKLSQIYTTEAPSTSQRSSDDELHTVSYQ